MMNDPSHDPHMTHIKLGEPKSNGVSWVKSNRIEPMMTPIKDPIFVEMNHSS